MADVESKEITTDRGRTLAPTAHFVRTPRRLDRCVDRGIVAAGVSALAVALTSVRWPRDHDAPLLAYMAWLIRHGYRPYRDIYDLDLPGAVLFHVAGQRLFGNSDLSLRTRDLLLLGAGLVIVFRVMRRIGARAAWVAVVLIAGRYLAYGGAVQSLRRDWILALLLVATIAFVLRPGGWWRYFLARDDTSESPFMARVRAPLPEAAPVDGGGGRRRPHRDPRRGHVARAFGRMVRLPVEPESLPSRRPHRASAALIALFPVRTMARSRACDSDLCRDLCRRVAD